MSSRDDRKREPRTWTNPAVFDVLERQRLLAEMAQYAAGNFHTFGGRAELAAEIRNFWAKWTEAVEPRPNQQCGTSLLPPNTTITKGSEMFKLMAGDYELAEKMSKEQGWPFDQCLKAIIKINEMATLSYMGGSLIQKQGGGAMTTKAWKKQQKKQQKIAKAAANYRMTGADPELDKAVFALNYRDRQAIGQRPGQMVGSALGLLTAGRVR